MIPLSYAQQRLWFLHRLEGPSPTYNSPTAWRVRGDLDLVALRAAVGDLVGRHEALRTSFPDAGGEPWQLIREAAEPVFAVIDVRADELDAALAAEAGYPFDLAADLPIRVTVLRLGPADHVLLLLLHHIAGDGWSLGPLVRDLSHAYAARAANDAPQWTELPVQYADYTLWQRELLEAEADGQLAYWRQQLSGLPTRVDLPITGNGGRPGVADRVELTLDAELHARLAGLAKQTGTSLFMVLQAGLAALLYRVGAGDDIPLGTPVAGRTDEALDDLVGFFVNTLVLRTDLSGEPSFRELLARVRETDLAAFAAQELPFDRLVEALNPTRSTDYHPLFQTMLVVRSGDDPLPAFGTAEVSAHPTRVSAARFDLVLDLAETSAGLVGGLDYRADLFDATTAQSLALALVRLLDGASADPDRPLATVELLSSAELHHQLVTWNDTAYELPARPLPDLIEHRVAATPDAVAVVCGAAELTYAELNARANRLAWHLRDLGAAPEQVVALALPRSLDLIVTWLAILKTGAAYLPIDLRYPPERVAYMMADAKPLLAVTAEATAAVVSDVDQVRLDLIDLSGQPETDLEADIQVGHTAYVIYTSGSTGKPKGVMVTHRGIPSTATTFLQAWQLEESSRVLLALSIGFDPSVADISATFLAGATLVVPPADAEIVGEGLADLIDRHAVTHIDLVPSMLASLPESRELPTLRGIVVGGEPLTREVAARFGPGRRLIQAYGPTETTVLSTHSQATTGEDTPTVGGPIRNTRLYVLDSRLQPVPVGVSGELYIAGSGVARGYLSRPGLTSERFVANPFGGPGERMYRTGDLVRWDADGNIVFIGRADGQVKLRGFRIELGEIESVLLTHPSVAQAAVILRQDTPGDQRLVAYVVSTSEPSELREHVAAALPAYMVPSAFVAMETIPLTTNGKLDRQALPVPDLTQLAGREPRDEREEVLCGLFAEVLGMSRVSIDDSFFDLGGHSLLATRLISRVRAAMESEVDLKTLFDAPTVASLASRLGQGGTRLALHRRERPELLPLSAAQQRLWFLDRLGEQGGGLYNVPVALRLTGALDEEALHAAVDAVVARHEALHTCYPEVDGEPYQLVDALARPEWTVRDSADPAADVALEAARGFDLAAQIPVRATLLRSGEQEHLLVLVIHHIATDGWSMAPLLRDLWAAYTGAELPELPVQYADYTLWQQELLETAQDGQLDFWRQTLAGLPERLELPTDRPRPAVRDHEGAQIPVRLEGERLAELARECNASVFMVAQALLAALLTRLGAGTDIPLGTPVAGRTDAALDDLVGLFINTLVLRTDTSGDPSLRELVSRVREADLAAFAHQDVPFERLVEALNPPRSTSHTPLFQVLLSLQNNSAASLDVPGLAVSEVDIAQSRAKFDLSLTLAQHESALEGNLGYATDLFDEQTARAIAERLVRLTDAALAEPDRPLGELPCLSDRELREQLVEWNGTGREEPWSLLPELFREQVARTPHHTALVSGTTRLSYQELNARANRLAHRLIAAGAGPEQLVAVKLPRSPELVTALLAVLKTGAAYLPVELDYPAERIEYMLADARPLLVVDETFLSAKSGKHSDKDPQVAIDPRNPAYVIYTSGSTGRPKGVLVEHRSLAAYLHRAKGVYPGMRGEALLHSPISFDFTISGLYTPLVTGGAVRIHDDAFEAAQPPTFLKLTPSHLGMHTSLTEDLATGGDLMLAGEALLGEVLGPWRERHPQAELYNVYGPTETCVNCVEHHLSPGDELPAGAVPIGRPHGYVRVYVLDDRLALQPAGVPGELYIAGPGVARGYLGRPGVTAERFVPDPYGEPGSRMYRTGDVVRWNNRGELVFLGRADGQVKLRGHRVELGEIEAAVLAHPDVSQAAVVVREDRLVGYVVSHVDSAALRDFVARTLPGYMVPAVFVQLETLPLTPNGKLDRKALPDPDFAPTAGRAARNPLEEVLCGLFAQVLGLPSVGIDDGFFDLGGHSLLATRLISRIRSVLGLEVSIRTLFDAPDVAALTRQLDGTSARPRARRHERPARVPLSAAQQRLWFLDRFGEAGSLYHVPLALRLQGELDVDALKEAFADVLDRHEALRTRYEAIDGEPYQVLERETSADWTVRKVKASQVDAAIAEVVGQPFDLAAEFPVRVALLRTAIEEHYLVLVIHHIATDGWSMGVLLKDLAQAYAARYSGNPPQWTEPPVQYADYALWQRELLDSEQDGQLAYWREALAGLPDRIELPTDRPRPQVVTYSGGSVPLRVEAELYAQLLGFAREQQVSVFMVLQAGLAALLSRMGAGSDIPIGTPVAGRTDDAFDELVGFFVNTLVLRTDTSGDPGLRELVGRVREADLGAFAHQDVPFERLVEALNPMRSMSHTPLFQVMLVLQNNAPAQTALHGLDVSDVDIASSAAKFDLTAAFVQEEESLGGRLEYNTDLFDPSTAQALADRLIGLLAAAVAEPELPLSALPILVEGERDLLLEEWNGRPQALPAASIPALFQAQVEAHPDRLALVGESRKWTYRQLDQYTDSLAAYFVAMGVEPESRVAVHLQRSPQQVAVTIAILKAGAAYVPIDARWPEARSLGILAQTQAKVLLTDAGSAQLAVPEGVEVLIIGDDFYVPLTAPKVDVYPDQAAYVMFTSGSTGVPKGVAVTHRNIVEFSLERGFTDGSCERVLFHSPYAFDASTLELWSPLLSGGTLYVAPPGEVEVETLRRLLAEHEISGLFLTVGFFRLMAEEAPEALAKVRKVWTGGEAVPAHAVRSILRHCPDTTVVDVYGPTEITTAATTHALADASAVPDTVPIGTPMDANRVYVLDDQLRLVPPGVPGELYLGGTGVSRGYLDQPGLTGARFVADPYAGEGARMYRTGDIARWRQDGLLDFIGRADDQVKLRGFRIELGEIEAQLAGHPSVAQVAVVMREDQPGIKRLVAYVVSPSEVDSEELRRHVAGALPEYMVPSAFVALEALPFTANGKLDRRVLPAPALSGSDTRAPRTQQEALLAGLFAEVLGVPQVGVEDDFFALGGHSLLALRLISRVHSDLGEELGVRTLFEAPSPASLATRLGAPAGSALDPLLPLRAAGSKPPLFCVHPAAGIAWVYSGLLRGLGPDLPIYGLQARGLEGGEPLAGVDEVAADCLSLIREVQPHGPYHLLGWSFGGNVAHALAARLQQEGEEVALVALLDAYPPTDLAPSTTDTDELRAALLDSLGIEAEGGLLGQDILPAVTRVFGNNVAIRQAHATPVYDGDVLLFQAAQGRPEGASEPDAWTSHVTGKIEVHPIQAAHGTMTRPAPLADIASVLRERL